MAYQDGDVTIRPIKETDLHTLWEYIYGDETLEWHRWDAPYLEHKHIPYDQFMKTQDRLINHPSRWVIEVDGNVIGTVNYYWEHEPSKWLEMGIGIYDAQYWNKGLGTTVLRLWINHLFQTMPLVRVGYTTWSGNERMIKVGEKLGMTMEARLRKCRYYNGQYYDSIRMGLLREEWEGNPLFHGKQETLETNLLTS